MTMPMRLDCPYCRRENDAITGLNAVVPNAGSLTVCWACHCIAIIEVAPDGPYLRKPDSIELVDIMADPDVQRALAVLTSSQTPSDAARRF